VGRGKKGGAKGDWELRLGKEEKKPPGTKSMEPSTTRKPRPKGGRTLPNLESRDVDV